MGFFIAPVVQLVETSGLSPVKCWFESNWEYKCRSELGKLVQPLVLGTRFFVSSNLTSCTKIELSQGDNKASKTLDEGSNPSNSARRLS